MRTTTCSTFVLSLALLAAAPGTLRAATPEQAAPGVQTVTRAGEIPFELGPRERTVEATASVKEPQSLRLADISVLGLHDRTVKLRFMMGGIPLPPVLHHVYAGAGARVGAGRYSYAATTTLTVVAGHRQHTRVTSS